jgi:hypothetical protein
MDVLREAQIVYDREESKDYFIDDDELTEEDKKCMYQDKFERD